MRVFREDFSELRPAERLADGRLRADAFLTRTGIFTYRDGNGERREYRPPDEVFKADALASFRDAVVTDDHPADLVSADNARFLAVGFVSGAPRRDGDHVAATLVVNDAATIAKMERGKQQLSCGYTCEIDRTPGIVNGERYDAVQRNIVGNHVAIVDVGRAGPTVRVRMDAHQVHGGQMSREMQAAAICMARRSTR